MKNLFSRRRYFGSGKSGKPEVKYPSPRNADADEDLRELIRLVGDERLAKRIQALKAIFPTGTTPELIVLDWLQKQPGVRFQYQVALFGGRRAPAGVGLVPDFVVWIDASNAMAWNIQGEYWHGLAYGKQRDELARIRMLGASVGGARIQAVIEIWENDLYQKRETTLRYAMAGVNLRGVR